MGILVLEVVLVPVVFDVEFETVVFNSLIRVFVAELNASLRLMLNSGEELAPDEI